MLVLTGVAVSSNQADLFAILTHPKWLTLPAIIGSVAGLAFGIAALFR